MIMMLWMWHVACWNKVVYTEGLLMEGSGSVLGFHQQLLGISKESWIFEVSRWTSGSSSLDVPEYPQHLTRNFFSDIFPFIPKWGACAESLFIWGNRDSTCVTAGGFFFSPLLPYFTYLLEKALEIGGAQRSCVHARWESSGLSPPVQAEIPARSGSFPPLFGRRNVWVGLRWGGRAELYCVPHWVSIWTCWTCFYIPGKLWWI